MAKKKRETLYENFFFQIIVAVSLLWQLTNCAIKKESNEQQLTD